jgi:hypothetical protein
MTESTSQKCQQAGAASFDKVGEREILVQIKFGSHLYGTNTPQSDLDYKSVYVPSAREILLQKVTGSLAIGKKTKAEGERNSPADIDNECYSLQRFLGLVSEGQTVAIDMLFAPEPMITSDIWSLIQNNRERLLTKKSAAFVGYCRTQANKYGIKGSRVAAAKNALARFEQLESEHGTTAKVGDFFGPDDEVIDEHTRTLRKETPNGRVERYFECCNRMVGFTNTVKEAASMFRKIHENYGARAQLAKSNQGVDWKALSHAVRVGREAIELLSTHQVTFPLPYAAHILEIKQGKLPYEEVAKEIEWLLAEVERQSEISTLQDSPDYQFIDDLVANVYGTVVRAALASQTPTPPVGPTSETGSIPAGARDKIAEARSHLVNVRRNASESEDPELSDYAQHALGAVLCGRLSTTRELGNDDVDDDCQGECGMDHPNLENLGKIIDAKSKEIEAMGLCKWEYADAGKLHIEVLTEKMHIFMVDHGISINGKYTKKVVEYFLELEREARSQIEQALAKNEEAPTVCPAGPVVEGELRAALEALRKWEHWYSVDSTEFNRDTAREEGLKVLHDTRYTKGN